MLVPGRGARGRSVSVSCPVEMVCWRFCVVGVWVFCAQTLSRSRVFAPCGSSTCRFHVSEWHCVKVKEANGASRTIFHQQSATRHLTLSFASWSATTHNSNSNLNSDHNTNHNIPHALVCHLSVSEAQQRSTITPTYIVFTKSTSCRAFSHCQTPTSTVEQHHDGATTLCSPCNTTAI